MAKFTKEQIERAAANGVSKSTLYMRASKGWDEEIAINTPPLSKSEAGRRSAASQPSFTIKRVRHQ